MIVKPYESSKIDLNKIKILLFYGKNEGQKKEIIKNLNIDNNELLNFKKKIQLKVEKIFYRSD